MVHLPNLHRFAAAGYPVAGPLLQSVAALAATERVGLMRVPTERMALHPPQTLERVEHQLNELIDMSSDGLIENGPSLLHWTRG